MTSRATYVRRRRAFYGAARCRPKRATWTRHGRPVSVVLRDRTLPWSGYPGHSRSFVSRITIQPEQ
jgi:hypothetical protein